MFQIDLGNNGGDGINVFLGWSARGTQDGSIRARQFYLREGSSKDEYAEAQTKGFVIDLDSLKTGWQKSEGMAGVAPEWKWNPSVNQMMQKPGDDYKKGFSVKCAIGGGKVAMWEQAGAGVWSALADLAPLLKDQPASGQMPLIKMTEAKELKFTKGSTCYPIFEIVKWVDKPDCLKEGAAAGIATEPAPAPEPAPAATADDDMEF
jgi:hypothetical protein